MLRYNCAILGSRHKKAKKVVTGNNKSVRIASRVCGRICLGVLGVAGRQRCGFCGDGQSR